MLKLHVITLGFLRHVQHFSAGRAERQVRFLILTNPLSPKIALKKSETFFLQAAKEAGIPLSKRLTVISRQRLVIKRKPGNGGNKPDEDTTDRQAATEEKGRRLSPTAQGSVATAKNRPVPPLAIGCRR